MNELHTPRRGRKTIPGVNDIETLHPALAAEWDAEKNAPLTPSLVSSGSAISVWWRCPEGHGYRAPVYSRAVGCGCPYCAGKRADPGKTDIAFLYPELMPEWNDERDPHTILPSSHKMIRWRCARGHDYEAMPYSRVRGSGCPYCMNRRVMPGFNDLASAEPNVAAEWHPDLNGALGPENVTRGCTKKVWWRCRFGHEWRATVYSRTREKKAGCPYCTGRYRSR